MGDPQLGEQPFTQTGASSATVVVVTYHSTDVLAGCLESIPPHAEVVIVSQDATEDVYAITRHARPHARIVVSERNRGFGAGCNLGAANATGEVLVFLNPDARFLDGSLERLVETTLANDGTLVGPRILDEDRHDVTHARNWSSPWTDAFDLLVPIAIQPKRWQRDIPAEDDVYQRGGSVPYIQGACMAIARERFAKLGGFDEEFFLFGEEEYLARRLAREGLTAILEPRASLTHVGHTSVAKTGGFGVEQYHRSRAIGYRRDSSSRDVGLWLGAIRAIPLTTVLLFLLLTAPIRPAIDYRGVEDAAWCRSALRGLGLGLLRRPVSGPDPSLR
jgi:N-acetylglucosaminyl-diphospho-decaprenol L-rhamnosyltransferase